MNESVRGSDFRERISPHLEVLLQFSLSLTRNGRDAMKLVREVMTEAYHSWDQALPEDHYDTWLHGILTKQFYNGFQQQLHEPDLVLDDIIDDSLIESNRLFDMTTADSIRGSSLAEESGADINYLRAVANLPMVFRTAMVLSYLEGFTNREIANLAGVQPHAIESLLNRGRGFLREELFAHLTEDDGREDVTNREMATG
jgi:RNA polymerase sigma-70 factor, ECF subfamily